MHTEILSKEQSELLKVVRIFSKDFYLVEGTAIALYLGHRQSIDFDLFTDKEVKRQSIKKNIAELGLEYTIIHEAYDQLHIIINRVKFTFFNFPFKIKHKQKLNDIITMPSLLDLGAMKAFAFGGRAKWKDYVDIYFWLKNNIQLKEINKQAKNIFGEAFNIKLFHQQLSYFADIDFSEPVTFLQKKPPTKEKIKKILTDKALSEF